MRKSRRKILVVDHQAADIRRVEEVLTNQYTVFTALSGKDALEIAQQKLPDLILLDIALEDIDGFEVCKQLKDSEATRNIPIIFLAEKGTADEDEQGLAAGAIDFLHKPLSPSIIELRVCNHLHLKYQTELLERISLNDEITELFNRRAFDLFLEREVHTAVRRNEEISLLMVEINEFNTYKTYYGRAALEHCMIQIADVLTGSVQRTVDVVAHFNSREKFALILPDTDLVGAECIGNLVIQQVTDLKIPFTDAENGDFVSISIGSITTSANATVTPHKMVKIANESLQYALQDPDGSSHYS
ncbi:MAG: diguanylate cyclase [Gammaproteobacteria bacterium]|nr:diguanylate cyclase [Gammaproteobacteria bacterium]